MDAVTDNGLKSLELPASYPLDAGGETVPHDACQPIGQRAWEAGEPGIACRSAAPAAPPSDEELAYFGRRPLRPLATDRFSSWFWADE